MSTRAALKSYFQTGDVPVQAEFEDLIDSLALATEVEAVQEAADAAADAAAEAKEKAYRALVRASWNGSVWSIHRQFNVASIATGASVTNGKVVTITFTSALPNAVYVPMALVSLNGGDARSRSVSVSSQIMASLNLVIPDLTASTVLYLVIF